jgi:hypothetical protein
LFETHSLPALSRCYPRSFTFYVAHSIRSIRIGKPGRSFTRVTACFDIRISAEGGFILRYSDFRQRFGVLRDSDFFDADTADALSWDQPGCESTI